MVNRRLRRGIVGVGALSLVWIAASNVVVVSSTKTAIVGADRVDAAPVIVVLGAGIHADGTPTEILADRLETALELYRAGRAPRILCSGDHGRVSHDEVGVMARYLEDRGVASEDIFLDHAGFDSWNTVTRAHRVFGVTRAIFVTQGYHLPRVLWTATHEGIAAQGVAADRHRYPMHAWYAVREIASRSKAVLDVAIGRDPKFLGPAIDLAGDGRATR